MAFTIPVPTLNVCLPFRTASLYLLFPDTVLCCQEELPFSRKWFMTGLRRWFCFLYAGVDDGVVMFLSFFFSFSLLYLEYCETKEICFSFLMVHFVKIDVFVFAGFLFAPFVWPFLCLIFPLDFLIKFLCQSYYVLV